MKKKFKWILIAIIAVLSCGAYGAALLKPVPVEAENAARGNLESRITVQAAVLPATDTVLNSVTAGQVVSLPFQVGSVVKAGEVLMRAGAAAQTDLELQREQYRQQLSTARQQYDRLFGERGTAKSGLDSAQSEFSLADKNFENARVLYEEGGYISQSELDGLKTRRDLAYQALLQAKEDDSEPTKEYYRSQIASAEKQLKTLENTVTPGEIVMPYDGVVWEIYTNVGSFLAPNQPVVRIYAPENMKLEASLLSEDALLIKPDQTARVKYADGTQEDARVTFVSRVATKELSSIGMEENRCSVELLPAFLPEYAGAGQQADVTFTIMAAKQVITVPSSAIVPGKEGSFIYVIIEGKAERQQVETGKKSGGRVEIISGLSEGETVVSDPYNAKLKEGSRVRAVFSSMQKEITSK